MSPGIWTRCGGRRNCIPYTGEPWRVVEGQHLISTRKLVDSDDEQRRLAELLDTVKPLAPAGPEFKGLHYLLFTPFRHPPLRHGSRFGSRHERSLWYGSEELPTALAEVAFYRLAFLDHAPGLREPVTVELSAFRARVRSESAIDLLRPPFDAHAPELCSRMSYAASQALGREMRADGVEVVRYGSARCEGANVALFTPSAFARKKPTVPQTWLCIASRQRVEFSRKDYFVRERHAFGRDQFEVEGALPAPAA